MIAASLEGTGDAVQIQYIQADPVHLARLNLEATAGVDRRATPNGLRRVMGHAHLQLLHLVAELGRSLGARHPALADTRP